MLKIKTAPRMNFCRAFLKNDRQLCVRRVFVCVLLLLGFGVNAQAAYRVDINAPWGIRSLLKKYLDIVRFSKDKKVNQDQFDFLVMATPKQIRTILATEGYFLPEIVLNVKSGQKDQVISIDVAPGDEVKVGKITLKFSGPILQESSRQQVATREAFSLRQGDVFTKAAWEDAKNKALKQLQSYRYLGAKIAFEQAKVDPYRGTVDIEVDFSSGPTFTLGKVTVIGQKRYPHQIINHVNPLHEGVIYNIKDIEEFQRRIQSTPYYASVAVNVSDIGQHSNSAPVSVRVSEFPYHGVGGGVGYATDTGMHVQGSYSYLNTFGHALPFRVEGRLDHVQQYGQVSLAMPPDQKGWVNSTFASYTTTDVSGTRIYSARAGIKRARTGQFIDYSYALLYYQDRLTQNVGDAITSRALVPSWSWTRRNIDNSLFPRSGNLLHIEADFAVQGVLSDQTFFRTYARGQQYFPLGRHDTLMLRLELGLVMTNGNADGVPASLLFRAGGANSIRGYDYQGIGDLVAGSVLPTKYLMTSTAEYQHWFTTNWGGAVFYDAGTATNDLTDNIFYQAAGVGIRWRSPVGPVNLDFAYGLQNKDIRPYLTLGISF